MTENVTNRSSLLLDRTVKTNGETIFVPKQKKERVTYSFEKNFFLEIPLTLVISLTLQRRTSGCFPNFEEPDLNTFTSPCLNFRFNCFQYSFVLDQTFRIFGLTLRRKIHDYGRSTPGTFLVLYDIIFYETLSISY